MGVGRKTNRAREPRRPDGEDSDDEHSNLTARANVPSSAQLVFASCTGPALSPLLRSCVYCVSTGELTRATESLTALFTQGLSLLLAPSGGALAQQFLPRKRMRM